MTLSIAPADEACVALVERLNAVAYGAPCIVGYAFEKSEDVSEDTRIRVDVIHEDMVTLEETLAVEDRTSHSIRVWVRKQVNVSTLESDVAKLNLIVRRIFKSLNNFDSSDRRVRVWGCDTEQEFAVDKEKLREMNLYSASCQLRVEVEAS